MCSTNGNCTNGHEQVTIYHRRVIGKVIIFHKKSNLGSDKKHAAIITVLLWNAGPLSYPRV